MPFSAKQMDFFNNANHRWNLKIGATRSGKTYMDYFVIPKRIRRLKNEEGLNVIMGNTKGTLQRNIIEPLQNIWGTDLVGDISSDNTSIMFGELVHCLGADKINQVNKIRGSSIKYCYGDEIPTWHEEVFNMLKSRLDKPYSKCDGTGNPEYPTHWFKKFLDSGADIYNQHYTIFDNPFLTKEFINNLCKEYEGTIYYDRYIKGLWKRAEGAIYKNFADNPVAFYCEVVDKLEPFSKVKQFLKSSIIEIVVGVDFGGTKSGHALVASGIIRGYKGLIILASERHFGQYKPNDIDELVINFIYKILDKYGFVDSVYWDNAESVLGRGITSAIESKFPQIIVRPAIKEKVNDRINCSVRLMGLNRFFYTDDCDTVKQALENAVWDKKEMKDIRLDDGSTDIDSLDAMEYTFERDIKKFIICT